MNAQSIGDNFTVYQGVTIGSKDGKIPTIKNNVTIFTNSVVCGEIVLNDACMIGALSYVDKDVNANIFVAGIPAKPIK